MTKAQSRHHLGIFIVILFVCIVAAVLYFVLKMLPPEFFKGEIIPENVSEEQVKKCRQECGMYISGSPKFNDCFGECVGE